MSKLFAEISDMPNYVYPRRLFNEGNYWHNLSFDRIGKVYNVSLKVPLGVVLIFEDREHNYVCTFFKDTPSFQIRSSSDMKIMVISVPDLINHENIKQDLEQIRNDLRDARSQNEKLHKDIQAINTNAPNRPTLELELRRAQTSAAVSQQENRLTGFSRDIAISLNKLLRVRDSVEVAGPKLIQLKRDTQEHSDAAIAGGLNAVDVNRVRGAVETVASSSKEGKQQIENAMGFSTQAENALRKLVEYLNKLSEDIKSISQKLKKNIEVSLEGIAESNRNQNSEELQEITSEIEAQKIKIDAIESEAEKILQSFDSKVLKLIESPQAIPENFQISNSNDVSEVTKSVTENILNIRWFVAQLKKTEHEAEEASKEVLNKAEEVSKTYERNSQALDILFNLKDRALPVWLCCFKRKYPRQQTS